MDVAWDVIPPSLVGILRRYATVCPTRKLAIPDTISFHDLHDFLLNSILLNPFFKTYPPSTQYQSRFWKWAVEILENRSITEDDEIDEQILSYHVQLMSESPMSQATGLQPPLPSYMTYMWGCGARYEHVTLKESRTTIESGTTGLKTWPASLVLAQYLLAHPELVTSRSVLELGSGVGFVGIITAFLQTQTPSASSKVFLTDVNTEVLARCSDNVALPCNASSRHSALQIAQLDWFDALENRIAFQGLLDEASADLVLGADIVYDPSIIPPLVKTLQRALTREGATALVALTVRNEHTHTQFLEAARSVLSVELLELDLVDMATFWGILDLGDALSTQEVKLYRIKRHNSR